MSSPVLLNHVKERAEKATELLTAVKDGKYPRDFSDVHNYGLTPEWVLRTMSGELAWCELYLERDGIGDTDIKQAEARQEEIKIRFNPAG